MGQIPEEAFYPARTAYRRIRTTNRTILAGLMLRDPQAMPPAAWCRACGAEVYRQDRFLCSRCGPEADD